jgi:HSP20 family protein
MSKCTVFVPLFLLVLVVLSVVAPSAGSRLPWLDRRDSSLSEQITDPFKILEYVPFGLDHDDVAMVALARVDWRETPNSHEIVIDVPGMKKEEEEKKGEHWHRVEQSYGKFWKQFRMPENADLESIKAKLENGVLTLTFAKLAPEKIKGPKVVSIEGEGEGKEKIGVAKS